MRGAAANRGSLSQSLTDCLRENPDTYLEAFYLNRPSDSLTIRAKGKTSRNRRAVGQINHAAGNRVRP
jgi:hypothetical protein